MKQNVDGRDQISRDAALLSRELERSAEFAQAQSSTGGRLVVLSGLPGTGKTHFAGELTRRAAFVVLETDRLRKLLVPKPKYTPGEHRRVFRVCHHLIEEYLGQGCRVLFDATNLTEKFRNPLRLISQRLGTPMTLVWLTAPRETVRIRLEDRSAGGDPANHSDADWLIYCRMAPYEEPIQGKHLMVDSSKDTAESVEDILRFALN